MKRITEKEALAILDGRAELLDLLQAAFRLRKKYFGREVMAHVINNVQNGHCQEDCRYCAQSRISKARIAAHPAKTNEEILRDARRAYAAGAWRYCMVYSGRTATPNRVDSLCRIIKAIKAEFPKRELCVSSGFLSPHDIKRLKNAGLNRLNHNINTSQSNYKNICSTHSFQDRWRLLLHAKAAGLGICSGVIIGMGETRKDIYEMATKLSSIQAESIPVNFFLPFRGLSLGKPALTPEFCLRVLCLFRLLNPRAEIKIAAGREVYLRGMQALGLFPANAIFLQGYLNAKGNPAARDIQLIRDAGFTLKLEN